jgi:hypothetical protein
MVCLPKSLNLTEVKFSPCLASDGNNTQTHQAYQGHDREYKEEHNSSIERLSERHHSFHQETRDGHGGSGDMHVVHPNGQYDHVPFYHVLPHRQGLLILKKLKFC